VLETEQTDLLNERVYTAKTVEEALTEDENISIHGPNLLTGEALLYEEYALVST